MNLELEVMRLGNLEAMCDETMNLGRYGEHEDRDEDQGYTMGRNKNTALMCQ